MNIVENQKSFPDVAVSASPTQGGDVYAIIGQTIPPSRLEQAIANPDALYVAYNVGVLELLSIALTILAIVLAIGAFFGFWMIRGAAMQAADKAAREHAQFIATREAARVAKQIVESRVVELYNETMESRGADLAPDLVMPEKSEKEVIAESVEMSAEENGRAS